MVKHDKLGGNIYNRQLQVHRHAQGQQSFIFINIWSHNAY